jgi:3-methyl-2-oxobutanoate hydroxymethyltransferase
MKQTINSLKQLKKENQKITMITAYDALFGKIFDGVADIILVGDSLNMSFAGKRDTLSATIEQMIYHTQAVCNGAKDTFVVCDMPFGSYTSKEIALKNAVKVYQESSADAIKIEGGIEVADRIKYLTSNSMAVMGHIGLMPQFVRSEGGYKIKGKSEEEIASLIEDARALESAGVFAIVVEGVKADVTHFITEAVSVPVIGIGSGADTDGQVLVWSDMLGLFDEFTPKFVRKYLEGSHLAKEAVLKFKEDVRIQNFPSKDEAY